jgi:hypothetical protein
MHTPIVALNKKNSHYLLEQKIIFLMENLMKGMIQEKRVQWRNRTYH